MAGLPLKLVSAFGVAAALTGGLRAQEPKKDVVDPKAPKVDPKGPKVDPKAEPKKEPDPPPVDLLAGGPGETAQQSRTASSSTYAPNMYGDTFGGSRSRLNILQGRLTAFSRVIDDTLSTRNSPNDRPLYVNYGPGAPTPPGSSPGITVNGNAVQARQLGVAGNPLATFPGAPPQFTTVDNYGTFRNRVRPVAAGTPPQSVTLPIQDNAAYREAVNGVFNDLYGPSGSTVFLPGGSRLVYTPPAAEGAISGVSDIQYQYDRFLLLDVPTPAAGGVVGRTKVAEDNNPLPRDRVFFNTDYFVKTGLTQNGFDVTRFAPGFEVTFLDQSASFELQMPFASTLDPVSSFNGGGVAVRDMVFGNVFAALKGLAYSGDDLFLAAGVGVAIPTAPDTVVKAADGSDFLRVKNETVNVVPFLAVMYAPAGRFYWQNWVSVSYDATGSPVEANFDGAGSRKVGTIRDQSVLALDTQIGYWLIAFGEGGGGLQALTPFMELHYNTTVSDPSTVRSGSLALVPSDDRYDEVNLTAGVAAYLDGNFLVSTSVVVPLSSGPDKLFDYQIGLRLSWFFGATAAARNPAAFAP